MELTNGIETGGFRSARLSGANVADNAGWGGLNYLSCDIQVDIPRVCLSVRVGMRGMVASGNARNDLEPDRLLPEQFGSELRLQKIEVLLSILSVRLGL